MGELVLGAVLGAVFQQLLSFAVSATKKIYCFGSKLDRLNSTVSSIERAVDLPEHLTEELREGKEFLEKCSTVKFCNVFHRIWYSHKLATLEDSLSKSFHNAEAALIFQQRRRFPEAETTNGIATLQEMSSETGEADSNGFEQSFPQERETLFADGTHAGLQLDESPIQIVSLFHINVLKGYQDSDSLLRLQS